jgi:gamma-glutamyl hercynylcysteine S-oxide synthase
MLAMQNGVSVQPALMERLIDARWRSDALFELVRVDVLYERPIPERHRIIFYLGHLEAFDRNLLYERIGVRKNEKSEFDRLFAFGIDPVGGGLPTDQPSDWPRLDSVREYVAESRTGIDEKLSGAIVESGSPDGVSMSVLLNVAIEHRLMHVETLCYMLHQLPLEQKVRTSDLPLPHASPAEEGMVDVPAGSVVLGLARGGEEFGWDNEYEAQAEDVAGFAIDRHKVTNRQFAEFIAVGGYETQSLWTDEDWRWKTSQGISHPVFWKKSGEGWLYRTMFDEIPLTPDSLAPDWPVFVSQAEAAAYTRWVGKSLPTEAEWQRAASVPNVGIHGLFGNGWEWTSSVFSPFHGFEPFPFYRGYSADFFDGKHFVMKGGSPVTAACMLRPTFRNWFQAHYQYVYAGFRCVSR